MCERIVRMQQKTVKTNVDAAIYSFDRVDSLIYQ